MKKFLYFPLLLLLFATSLPVSAKSAKKEVSLQLYSIRELLGTADKYAKNHVEVLKSLAAMGYTSVEAANYGDGKFYGVPAKQFKADVEAAGLKVLSSHTTRGLSDAELKNHDFTAALAWWDACISAHKEAGMKYIVTPWSSVPKTIADLQTLCDYHNEIGKKCKAAGILYGYHNHSHEFSKVEEKEVMLDYMISHTNPEYVFFEMDVYWAVMGQASPVQYFKKYPGRFTLLHIKDRCEVGQSGMVGYDAIFKNAKIAGLKDIVVELEGTEGAPIMEGVRTSVNYLLESTFVKASYSK